MVNPFGGTETWDPDPLDAHLTLVHDLEVPKSLSSFFYNSLTVVHQTTTLELIEYPINLTLPVPSETLITAVTAMDHD